MAWSLGLLSLFRNLRYASYLGQSDRTSRPHAQVILTLVRSELASVANHFESELALELPSKREQAAAVKIARAIHRELERVDAELKRSDGAAALSAALETLAAMLRDQVVFAARALGGDLTKDAPFGDVASRLQIAERLSGDLAACIEVCRRTAVACAENDAHQTNAALRTLRRMLSHFQDVALALLRFPDRLELEELALKLDELGENLSSAATRSLAASCEALARNLESRARAMILRAARLPRTLDVVEGKRIADRFAET